MAGVAKPNVEGIGKEGSIVINSFSNSYLSRDPSVYLFNGITTSENGVYGSIISNGGSLLTIDFNVENKSSIWAIGSPYTDPAGITGKNVTLYKYNEKTEVFDKLGVYPTKNDNNWYLLLPNIEAGRYKIEGADYIGFNEWYVEIVKERKILLKSNNKTYSLKSEEVLYETKMTSNTTPTPFVASASSELSGYPAWKAFDGTSILDNSWFTNGVKNGWIQIKFDTIKNVNFVDLKVYNLNSAPRELSIEYSDDGIKWDVAVKKIIKAEWNVSDSNRIYFNNIIKALYFRINIYDTINNLQVGFTEITYGYLSNLYEVPTVTSENFLKYGTSSIENFDLIQNSKNYILQDTVSEDTDGLWKQELNRKPLSIKFE